MSKFKLLIIILTSYYCVYGFNPDTIRASLPHLSAESTKHSMEFRNYQKRYGLDTLTSTSFAGTFQSDSFLCVGQVFQPDQPIGTVFFLHGFFDHTGTIINGIKTCLNQRYTVAVMDLPGHGLSSGERGAINDFSEYVNAFRIFMNLCKPLVDSPYVFIGHSTGCAVAYQQIVTQPDVPFEKVIFLAPLVRTSYYHISVIGNNLFKNVFSTLPRWFRRASHDKEFLRQFQDDPLQPRRFSVRWANAYYRWFDNIKTSPVQTLPLVIIQGTDDDVVDWKYNLPFLQTKFNTVTVVTIKKARHQLLNETPPYYMPCKNVIEFHLHSIQ